MADAIQEVPPAAYSFSFTLNRARFGVMQASIDSWLKQDRIDRGEAPGMSTEGQMELAAAKRRIRQLETELTVSRKVNEVFLEQNMSPKASTR